MPMLRHQRKAVDQWSLHVFVLKVRYFGVGKFTGSDERIRSLCAYKNFLLTYLMRRPIDRWMQDMELLYNALRIFYSSFLWARYEATVKTGYLRKRRWWQKQKVIVYRRAGGHNVTHACRFWCSGLSDTPSHISRMFSVSQSVFGER